MRRFLLTILILGFFSFSRAQQFFPRPDSLKLLLSKTSDDTTKVRLLADLSWTYAFLDVDTSILYAQTAMSLARQVHSRKGEAAGMSSYGWGLWAFGNYDRAIEVTLKPL